MKEEIWRKWRKISAKRRKRKQKAKAEMKASKKISKIGEES
jgi:hypothetical protein